MNKLAPVFLAVAVALTALAIYQHQQAEHLRAVIAQMNKDASAAREEADTHSVEIRGLKERTRTQKVAIDQLETRNKELANADPGETAMNSASGSEAEESGGFMKGLAKMFTDPKMKDAMRAQQAVGVNMLYADLAAQLGLNPEEARSVLALLTNRQMEMASTGMAVMSKGGLNDADLEESGKRSSEAKSAYDKELKAVLGEERFARLEEYEKTIGDRFAFDQVRNQLSASGTPLDAAQADGLLAIMKEERMRTPNQDGASNANPAEQVKILRSDKAMDGVMKAQASYNGRVLDRARSLLSPDQLQAFEAAQKAQIDAQRMGVEMSREMLKKK